MQEFRSDVNQPGTAGKAEAVPGSVTFSPDKASLEANKDLVRRYEKAFIAGKLEAFDELVAADYVEHFSMPDQKPGLQGLKDMVAQMQKSFTEPKYEEQELFAEGDRVIERWKVSLKHSGRDDLFGEPTGRKVAFTGIDIFRIADGKIVEHWGEVNLLGALQELGVRELPGTK